jgi:transglutaminase-like putative cysteine protease
MHIKTALVAGLISVIFTAPAAFSEPDWVKEVASQGAGIIAPDEATAVVLLHTTEVKISKSGKAEADTRAAFKILTRAGMDHAEFSHPVYPFLRVDKLKCWVVKPSGKVHELEKDDVISIGYLESAGYYDDSQVMHARPPYVEPGDVVAFEIETREDGWTSFYQSFVFQVQQPVRFAQFSVQVPRGWDVIYGTWRAEDIDFEREENRYVWTARGLDYQPEEPLAPSWYFLSRRLSVSCYDPEYVPSEKSFEAQFADWNAVSGWLAAVYREPSLPNEEVSSESAKILGAFTSLEEKVRAVAGFCQNDVRYVAIEIGKNRWEPRPAPTTLFNRYGDCKDKSVLMVSMLETAGIRAVPVLCNSHYPVDPRVPNPFVFNHCIVGIPVEEIQVTPAIENAVVDGWLFFDPTDPATGIGHIPWNLQGNRVLVGGDADSALVRLPYPEPADFRRVFAARARLRPDGSISADVKVTSFGGAAAYTKYFAGVRSEKDMIDNWQGSLSATVPSVTVSDFSTGADGDSAWTSFTIESGHYIQDAGNLAFLRPDIFQETGLPVLTADERHFPVWLGSPRETVTDVIWELPEGWTAEVDVPAADEECEAAGISSRTAADGSSLRVTNVYRRNGYLIWPEDYESAKHFTRRLNQINGQVVMIQRP